MAAVLLTLLAFPAPSFAREDVPVAQCTCYEREFDRRLKDAGAVFTGTVRSIDYDDSVIKLGSGGRWTKNLPGADDPVIVVLDVDHVYKGADDIFSSVSEGQDLHASLQAARDRHAGAPGGQDSHADAAAQKTFVLRTSRMKYTCSGYPFNEGERYLVFAYHRQPGGRSDPTDLYGFPQDTYGVGGLCGGTKEVAKAAADLARLKDVAPEEEPPKHE